MSRGRGAPIRLSVWCNNLFSPEATRLLDEGVSPHDFTLSPHANASVLSAGRSDPAMAAAEVVLGQPQVADCLASPKLRWVHLTTAGYSRYDTAEIREALRNRDVAVTTSSAVFADPCAQHLLAMILALARHLPHSVRDQLTTRSWDYEQRKYNSRLLTGQTVVMLGYGAIGRRLAELLAPFRCALYAVRRQARSENGVRIVPESELTRILGEADHVVDILPDNETTRNFVNARRLSCCKPGARFYNVGRGTTVDQTALIEALCSGRIGAAYLDVVQPEPLPPDHPLWSAPNCHITPHTGGGRLDQDEAIVRHFLANLKAWGEGGPLADRVI